jgi:hypothetical protein
MHFKNKRGMTRFLRNTVLYDNEKVYANMRLLYENLQYKSNAYLDDVIVCLKDKTIPSRVLNRYIKHNKEIFDLSRFMEMVTLLKEERTTLLMYLPQYHSLLKGVSIEDGIVMVHKLKKDKATSKEGFISRHGTDIGNRMFKKFQHTSSLSINTMREQGFDFRVRSHWCKEYWINKGYSEKDAIDAVKLIQHNYAGINPTIWRSKGYSEEEIDKILSDIDNKKGASYCFDKLKTKHPYLSDEDISCILQQRKDRMVLTFIEKELAVPIEDQQRFSAYTNKVRRLTEKVDKTSVVGIESRGVKNHLDHRYSILRGFLDNVPAEMLSHPYNLEIIPCTDNLEKASSCSVKLEDLVKVTSILSTFK